MFKSKPSEVEVEAEDRTLARPDISVRLSEILAVESLSDDDRHQFNFVIRTQKSDFYVVVPNLDRYQGPTRLQNFFEAVNYCCAL